MKKIPYAFKGCPNIFSPYLLAGFQNKRGVFDAHLTFINRIQNFPPAQRPFRSRAFKYIVYTVQHFVYSRVGNAQLLFHSFDITAMSQKDCNKLLVLNRQQSKSTSLKRPVDFTAAAAAFYPSNLYKLSA